MHFERKPEMSDKKTDRKGEEVDKNLKKWLISKNSLC